MTIGAFFGSYDSPAARIRTAVAHRQLLILTVAIALDLVSHVVTLPDLLARVAAFATLALMTVAILAMYSHLFDTALCVQCMADVPADAPVRAQRWRRMLWLRHFMSTRLGAAVTLLIAGALGAAQGVSGLQGAARLLFAAPADLFLFAVVYAGALHHRLRPWCLYCREWDGDGDPEPSPDPTVFGTKTAH
ncbi:hypothetical protein MTY66_63130 (plasmid) [Mycolicibacterium sp. TY66]|jgi:multisubunit Na+/H+ antiporter MnhF subunit|uniref:hypothetical protein n=1 Tax=unclassified Mycolicibacterium TaxID=2636767 RepID=UPI001BB3915A|nr:MULTISPECIES: hypothetical protein [unclassified Mycolicibacterium]BCI84688.1 hypothetical protein MTY66_63130 [Mycolicibacterium sp. TY66]BCJ84917.1 hypothetical protein MTY81_62900 [Mycolicibacterium sp. TY81]